MSTHAPAPSWTKLTMTDFAVGGEILDLALGQAKIFGRIVKCGSEYLQRSPIVLSRSID